MPDGHRTLDADSTDDDGSAAVDPTLQMYLGFWLSLAAFGLAARWYVVPWIRRVDLVAAATPILLLHMFRHFGLFYVNDAVVRDVPSGFADPTAYGDLATALLAALALAALRNGWAGAVALVWAFNVVGFVDLGIAAVNAQRVDLLSHFIGTAYWLPILVVPLLLVTHVLLAWRMTGDRATGVPVAAPTAG